jgi:hypothetical protein
VKTIDNQSVFLFLITLICCACEPDPVPYYPIPGEVKPYVIFPEGSYWIYEEVTSSSLDTIKIYRSEISKENGSYDFGYDFELFVSGARSSFRGDSILGYGQPFSSAPKMWSYTEQRVAGASGPPMLTFFGSDVVGESINFNEDWITFESKIESLEINGLTFQSVRVFTHDAKIFSNQPERVYFARDVGIIKRELFNGEIWQVKKYFINK